jgi:hypothetical protein
MISRLPGYGAPNAYSPEAECFGCTKMNPSGRRRPGLGRRCPNGAGHTTWSKAPFFTPARNSFHSSASMTARSSGFSVLRSITCSPSPVTATSTHAPLSQQRCHTRPVSSRSVITTPKSSGGFDHLSFERNMWFKPLSNLEVRGVSGESRVNS